MKELSQVAYVKRTQKDYSLSLKLQIVKEIEAGRLEIKECTKKYGIQSHSTVLIWLRKYGNFDWDNQTLNEIKKFCEKYKLTFADLISRVLYNNNIEYNLIGNKAVIGQEEYDLINNKDLGELNAINQVEWTTDSLKIFICETPSIQTVCLTRQPKEPYLTQWTDLINYNYGRVVNFKNIFTPSGQGLKGTPRINHFINHWLFNENENYDQLDNNWLTSHNVDRNIFNIIE